MRSLLLLVLVVGWAPGVLAEDDASGAPAVDPAAKAILRGALEPIMNAQALEAHFRAIYDVVQDEGHKLQFATRASFHVRRPDRVRVTTSRDDGRYREIFYDGGTFSVLDAGENVYGQFPAPDTIDATFDFLELEIGMSLPMADLFYNDLSPLVGIALSGEVVGPSRVEEWSCDHLAFRGEFVDWQLWVERGDAPRIRRFVITYHQEPGEPQISGVFDRWNLEAELPDEDFVFVPPEGVERIPVLARPIRARGGR